MPDWIDQKTLRLLGLTLAIGAAAFLVILGFPRHVLDRFYQHQTEAKAIEVWKRQAVDLDYSDCRETSTKCLDKIVAWPITRLGDGTSYWGTKMSQPIRWRNPKQVPFLPGPNHPFEAVARVVGIDPDAVVLLYIGSTDAQYSGTTSKGNFGYEQGADHAAEAGPPVDASFDPTASHR